MDEYELLYGERSLESLAGLYAHVLSKFYNEFRAKARGASREIAERMTERMLDYLLSIERGDSVEAEHQLVVMFEDEEDEDE